MAFSEPDRKKPVFVVPQWFPPGIARPFAWLFVAGVIVSVAGLGLVTALSRPLSPIASYRVLLISSELTLALVLPGAVLCRQYPLIMTRRRALKAGAGYGIGLVAPPCAIVAYEACMSTNTIDNGATFPTFLLLVIAGAMILVLLLWEIVRIFLPEFVKQDGTRCTHCAYCLLGVQSMRCPECGHAFTFAEIETTSLEFQERSAHHAASEPGISAKPNLGR